MRLAGGGAFGSPFFGTWGPSKRRLPNTYVHMYISDLLIKLATGATRGLLEAFFQELGPFKRALYLAMNLEGQMPVAGGVETIAI